MSLNSKFLNNNVTWTETPENVFEVVSMGHSPGKFPTEVYVFEMLSVRAMPGLVLLLTRHMIYLLMPMFFNVNHGGLRANFKGGRWAAAPPVKETLNSCSAVGAVARSDFKAPNLLPSYRVVAVIQAMG